MVSVKTLLLAGAATAVLAPKPAAAQYYNWTGFYVGLNAGADWGRSNASTSIPCTATANPPGYICTTTSGVAQAAAVAANGTGGSTGNGFTGGVQAGYNWQINSIVSGLETDFGAFHLRSSRTVHAPFLQPGAVAPQPGTSYSIGSSTDTDWLFTLRGRLGWAFSNVLLYGTGGLAVTRVTVVALYGDNVNPGACCGAISGGGSATKIGLTVGGGGQWAFAKNWSVKAEYLFLKFGSVMAKSVISNPAIAAGYAQAVSTTADLTASIARLGVNYQF